MKDVADGIVLAMKSEKSSGEAFNITCGNDFSIKEMAEIIKKYIPNTEFQETEARKIDVNRGKLDISKAKKLLNYDPKYDLESGIKEYIEWMIDVYFPTFDKKIKNQPVM